MTDLPPQIFSAPADPAPKKRRPPGLYTAIAICVGGCLCPFLAGTLLFPVFGQAKEAARATVCRQNLQEVGDSILAYEQTNGHFPHQLDEVSYSGSKQVSTDNIKCPKILSPGFARGYAYDAANFNGKKLTEVSEEDRIRIPLVIEIEDADTDEVHTGCTFSTRHLSGKWVNAYFIGEGALRIQLSEEQVGLPVYEIKNSLFAQRKQAISKN